MSSGDPYSGLRVRWPNIPLVQDGRLGNRLVNRDNNDFAPRIGLAWSPTSKWVIRTGAGMFYNQDQGNPASMSRGMPPAAPATTTIPISQQ